MDITLERILELLPHKPDGKLVHGARTVFARSIGAADNIFAEWVAGRNKSYNNYLYQISDKYNVSVEWLKGETDIKEKAASQMGDDFSRMFAQLTPQNQDLIRQMLEQLTKAQAVEE